MGIFTSTTSKFFGIEIIFSLVTAVGKLLQVDMATTNKMRPSYARVKVEVDLLSDLSKRVNVGIKKKTGEIMAKWITIKYDYLPKYCKNCKLQGHNKKKCFVLHPELYPKDEEKIKKEEEEMMEDKDKEVIKNMEKKDQTEIETQKGTTFQEQRNRNGARRGRHLHRGQMVKKWHKKITQ